MIDTLEGTFRSVEPSVTEGMVAEFVRACGGRVSERCTVVPAEQEGVEARRVATSWQGDLARLGPCLMTSDGSIMFGGSVGKRQQVWEGVDAKRVDKGAVLSRVEVAAHVAGLRDSVSGLSWLSDRLEVRRADICYQRKVVNCMEVIANCSAALKATRKGEAHYCNGEGVVTGLMLRGNAVAHRLYDKGLESGDSRWGGWLRSEEQLRSESKGLGRVWNVEAQAFDSGECVDVMNERYLGQEWGVQLDLAPLLAEGRDTEVLMLLRPDLAPAVLGRYKRSMQFRLKRQVRMMRAAAVPVDLRVPVDAWDSRQCAA